MAVPTNTQQTFQQIGNREDLSDKIYDITPVETPFLSKAKRGRCTAVDPEWQTDELAAPNGDNKTIEGDDATTDAATPTVRPKNYVQLMDKVVRTSSTADAITTAGRKRELSYQITKRSRELKRDQETRLTGNYPSVVGAAGTARETAGVEAWLETNVSRGATGADGGYTAGTGIVSAATDGTQRAFTEALLKPVIKDVWEAGGSPKVIMVGPSNKQTASTFPGIATLYRDTGPKGNKAASILGAADIYVSDFGEHSIVPNRFSRDRTALVLDMDYWEVKYLQPYKVDRLAKTGHSERRMLSAEFTLCSKNEKASGAVADLTTA